MSTQNVSLSKDRVAKSIFSESKNTCRLYVPGNSTSKALSAWLEDRAFQFLDGAGDAGIGAVGVEVAVVPGLLEIRHGR
jgi:hypothetical protein